MVGLTSLIGTPLFVVTARFLLLALGLRLIYPCPFVFPHHIAAEALDLAANSTPTVGQMVARLGIGLEVVPVLVLVHLEQRRLEYEVFKVWPGPGSHWVERQTGRCCFRCYDKELLSPYQVDD